MPLKCKLSSLHTYTQRLARAIHASVCYAWNVFAQASIDYREGIIPSLPFREPHAQPPSNKMHITPFPLPFISCTIHFVFHRPAKGMKVLFQMFFPSPPPLSLSFYKMFSFLTEFKRFELFLPEFFTLF